MTVPPDGNHLAAPTVGEARSLPLRRSRLGSLSEGAVSPNGLTVLARKLSVYERVVTGRVREPTYQYKLRAALSGGIAARVA